MSRLKDLVVRKCRYVVFKGQYLPSYNYVLDVKCSFTLSYTRQIKKTGVGYGQNPQFSSCQEASNIMIFRMNFTKSTKLSLCFS